MNTKEMEDLAAKTRLLTAQNMVTVLAERWKQIVSDAQKEANDGKTRVGVSITFDFTHKSPAVSMRIRYGSPDSDDVVFTVDDPEQGRLEV